MILDISKQIQLKFPDLLIVGTAFSWLRQFLPNVTSAVIKKGWSSLIGLGRSSFAYPDLVKDLMQNGKLDPHKVCITCSYCTQCMRDGRNTGCVVRDGTEYKRY